VKTDSGDGFGTDLTWDFEDLRALAVSQVNRRWDRFFKPLIVAPAEMIETCASSPKVLAANYRKTVWANCEAAAKYVPINCTTQSS